jgi:transposase, IS5 family
MSLCFSGLEVACGRQRVMIDVPAEHPLLKLAEAIRWSALAEIVLADLKRTTAKGHWWLGRKLKLRIHLGALLLQWLYNLTDRQVEWALKDNAAYQLFCGRGVVESWHCPDHTKIEEFRSRLSSETQQMIANQLTVWASELGFADPSVMDIDSTVQEANMAYPSEAQLMVKITQRVDKVWTYMKRHVSFFGGFIPSVDVKAVGGKAKAYFFRTKTDSEKANSALQALWHEAFAQVTKMTKYFPILLDDDIQRMPWNIRRALNQVQTHGSDVFLNAVSFILRGEANPDKALSFHLQAVSCFNKGKAGKGLQFGRAFQLGRIGGNFLLAGTCDSVPMEDKHNVRPMIETHQALFGNQALHSFGSDKSYYSQANRKYLQGLETLKEFALQQPGQAIDHLTEEAQAAYQRLANRRAGIEPLIGHAKHGGQLGKSRMKKDETTLSAGYGSIAGFNLRQLLRQLLARNHQVDDAGILQGAADDQYSRDRQYCGMCEAQEGVGGRDQTRQHDRKQGQQRNDVVTPPSPNEQHKSRGQNAEGKRLFAVHGMDRKPQLPAAGTLPAVTSLFPAPGARVDPP